MIGFENPTKKFSSCYGPNGIVDGDFGGTTSDGDCNSWHPEVWAILVEKFNVKSLLDIGCGVGLAQSFFEKNDIENLGIDATEKLRPHHAVPNKFVIHDMTKGPYKHSFDMVWSCDVFEHIDEEYVQNILDTLDMATKVAAFSAAPAGWGGHHHVNCKNPDYWIEKVTSYTKFKYDEALTKRCRASTPTFSNGRDESYFARSGLVFTKD